MVFMYILYEYSNRFVQPVAQAVVQPFVQPAAKCKWTFNVSPLSTK